MEIVSICVNSSKMEFPHFTLLTILVPIQPDWSQLQVITTNNGRARPILFRAVNRNNYAWYPNRPLYYNSFPTLSPTLNAAPIMPQPPRSPTLYAATILPRPPTLYATPFFPSIQPRYVNHFQTFRLPSRSLPRTSRSQSLLRSMALAYVTSRLPQRNQPQTAMAGDSAVSTTSTTRPTLSSSAAVEMGWSKWGQWASCSANQCGQRIRTRSCIGGAPCAGSATNMEDCNFVEACLLPDCIDLSTEISCVDGSCFRVSLTMNSNFETAKAACDAVLVSIDSMEKLQRVIKLLQDSCQDKPITIRSFTSYPTILGISTGVDVWYEGNKPPQPPQPPQGPPPAIYYRLKVGPGNLAGFINEAGDLDADGALCQP